VTSVLTGLLNLGILISSQHSQGERFLPALDLHKGTRAAESRRNPVGNCLRKGCSRNAPFRKAFKMQEIDRQERLAYTLLNKPVEVAFGSYNGVKKHTNAFRVLVVEDNEGLAFIVQIVLEAQGYQVRTARDGRDGYLTYLLFMPDLVITDIEMPQVNGLEMMRAIRMHDPKVRTIYLSGQLCRFRSLLEDEQKTYGIDLLRKPFSSIELTRLVSKVFAEVSECKRNSEY